MHAFINSSWQIASLKLPHRLIQGPLAGYSCAPFRVLFNQFIPPAYCVSEMSSARDILYKHSKQSRYLYRDPQEKILAYQISGTEPEILAAAALFLQEQGADLIDINCGCPKAKIRKKGAGSALLEQPKQLSAIIQKVRKAISIPLTVKIRIQGNDQDLNLAQQIIDAGADALIVHGRRWQDDYDIACDLNQIAKIKQLSSIPVIANGDIRHPEDLARAIKETACDAYMIARGGSGHPWLYQELLQQGKLSITKQKKIDLFITHLQALAQLEDEYKALLQSKSLVRYYFRHELTSEQLSQFYTLASIAQIQEFLSTKP
ncbi:tRNA-dihydrouridine synthase [Legionella sp. km772]|uniref:tRNA dihydrouridine synthase n=1 Tax=Legionella sp. km772 TaxID=2498111 RepID=UPI000F8ECB20|nr:tRNA-dihydrouridine synthase family protein [Legionella sp. km772]RUR13106.1 tRNA-dihydrouridine synthase family protein [Legionella sp. km772]